MTLRFIFNSLLNQLNMSVALWVSVLLAIPSGIMSPFSERLTATALWAGKSLIHPEDAQTMPYGLMDALRVGKLSRINSIIVAINATSLVVSLLHGWWFAPIVFVFILLVREVAGFILPIPTTVEWYLNLIKSNLVARSAAFDLKGDQKRAMFEMGLSNQIATLITMVEGTKVPVPDIKYALHCPYGDPWSLLRYTVAKMQAQN